MADGRTRRTIMSLSRVDLFAPALVGKEVTRQASRIARHAALPPEIVTALLEDMLSRLSIVAVEGYAVNLDRAVALARRAGAVGDEDYIALALTLASPIWTLDRDFRRVPGIRLVDREGVETMDRT